MIFRYYLSQLNNYLQPGKVLVICGPRRVGKTTLIKEFLKTAKLSYRFETGDDIRFRETIESQSVETLREYARNLDLVVIDEAQQIENIGLALKLLVDHAEGLRIIATGSASLDLANKIGEPLTGRKISRTLFPISQMELAQATPSFDLRQKLEEYLVYGSYPETLTTKGKKEKAEYLHELVGSYLFRDILTLERVKSSKVLIDLLRLVAYQIGKDVSIHELALQTRIDTKTVSRYLDLLEKSFVICSLSGLSKNLRKEISKSKRYYFFDNGIRNALISNFSPLERRNDVGELWENFAFIERMKRNEYLRVRTNNYFWRTYDQKEIDLVEESEGHLAGYEFKWREEKSRGLDLFLSAYPNSSVSIINKNNYLEFTGAKK